MNTNADIVSNNGMDNDECCDDIHEDEINADINIKITKKRVRKFDSWKANKRAKNTLSGKEHVAKSGKIIKAKSLKPGCVSCKKKCTVHISENDRQDIFNNYWNTLQSWDSKRQFIVSHVKNKPISRRRPKDNTRGDERKQSIWYYLDANGEEKNVCKVFFLNTLGISEKVVRNVLKNKSSTGFLPLDMRGRHVPPNKLPEDVIDGIRTHIKSFPTYPSHYSREKTAKHFLGSDLNQEKMYRLYRLKCEEEGVLKNKIAKCWAYKHIFQTEFNLSFKHPSTDTCDECDNFKLRLEDTSINNTEKANIDYQTHLDDAQRRYNLKQKDKETSKTSEKTKIIMLDLQKCLPTSYLSNALSFYLLKLWTLNLTIFDATEKKSYCMLWDESKAGRGGHEIASALFKWMEIVIANSDIETLIIWSDNCPSQNRNIMMMVNYLWLLNKFPNLKIIKHKFLLRGHTHLEADHVHGLIERNLRKQPTMSIVTPWDWQQLIRSSGATVHEMNVEDFKNFDVLYSQHESPFVNRKINTDKEKFLISSAVWLEVRDNSPGIIYYKTDISVETYKKLNLVRAKRMTNINLPVQLPVLRNCPKSVTQQKRDHLISLLKWVPVQFHDFYKNIPVARNDEDEQED